MESFDTLLRGGLVVTPEQEAVLDIGIRDGCIAAILAPGSSAEASDELDVNGKIVFPGGVECHAHIFEPMHRGWLQGSDDKNVWLQSPEGATRAAVCGGTTTVMSFAFTAVYVAGEPLDVTAAITERQGIFAGRSFCDYAFHPVLTGVVAQPTLDSLAEAIRSGTPTVKIFTTDVTSAQTGIMIDTGSLIEVMQVCARHGGLLMAHTEEDGLIKHMEAKLRQEGKAQLRNARLVHSDLGEEVAFRRMLRLADAFACPLYLVHVAAPAGLDALRDARRGGQAAYGETLHNLLCFSGEDYGKPDGAKYHIAMGLPSKQANQALWEGLADGSLSTLATDEYTTSYKVKMSGFDIESTPGGHAGIETRGIIGFSEGYMKGRLSLRRFAEVFASNPARIMGLHPRKGVIAPGSDADLAIWDPSVTQTITLDMLHHDSDYSPWEGWQVRGWPAMTLLRGKVMAADGRVMGTAADGHWLPRALPDELRNGPMV
jgi:dihydropyrimidinase